MEVRKRQVISEDEEANAKVRERLEAKGFTA